VLQIEVVPPVNGIGFVDEPEIAIDDGEDEGSSTNKELGVEVVEFVVEVVHLVGVVLGVGLVGRVEDEPFAGLEHGSQEVHVLLERQLEVLGVDDCPFLELLVPSQPTERV